MHLFGRGYLQNHGWSNIFAVPSAVLFRISAISNQPVAGSHIVNACRFNSFPCFVVMMYGPIRSTHIVSQGFWPMSFKDSYPYFLWGFLHIDIDDRF
jgi:hypothetical protein